MGVETKIPDKSSPGAEYPRYDELGSEWRGRDRVFVHRKFFDEMAAGSFDFDQAALFDAHNKLHRIISAISR